MLETEFIKKLVNDHRYKEAKIEIDKMLRAAGHTYNELRNILLDVSNPVLEQQGLGSALEHYASLLGSEKIRIKNNLMEKYPPNIEYSLFRISQVALDNSMKHAQINKMEEGRVSVELSGTENHILVTIRDNGIGFDTSIMNEKSKAFGLKRMMELAKMINGNIKVRSTPGEGTEVIASVQLREVLVDEKNTSLNRR